MRLACFTIDWRKSDGDPIHERLHFGFVADLAEGLFKVSIKRWETLRDYATAILEAKQGH